MNNGHTSTFEHINLTMNCDIRWDYTGGFGLNGMLHLGSHSSHLSGIFKCQKPALYGELDLTVVLF